jgi:DNA-binding NarL/FixJ family response regulator
MNPIRILLADDHAVVRQGFRAILAQQSDMVIVGEAGNGREVLTLAQQTTPDLIVMDVAMPELNGIEAARRLTTMLPHVRILALSMHKESIYVREMLKAGARGYLLKDSGEQDLLNAVRVLAKGGEYISPAVQPALMSPTSGKFGGTTPLDQLTSREREVLQLIAEGKTNKEIATLLSISVFTVDAHRGRIMEKINVHNVNELVRFAVRNGLVD